VCGDRSCPRWVMVFKVAIVETLRAHALVALKTYLIPSHSSLGITSLGLSARQRSPLLLRTAKVRLLKLCNFLIIDRKRCTPVTFFTDEVKLLRWLMTG
jgi:hypothetical protein